MKRIIFVDDDLNVGQAMQRMLRPMRREWDMVFVTSGEEALQIMAESEPFDIVVSDMHMPGMHGNEFLAEVMSRYPDTIRFVLSGEAGTEALIQTSSIVHQFMEKPFEAEELLQLITRAFALRDQLENSGIKQLLLEMGGVPSMPALYQEILQEMQSPAPSVDKVAAIIEKDAGMSAKVLQIVNSSIYGFKQQVSVVGQAARLLGLSNIRNLVLAAETFQPMDDSQLPSAFNINTLWDHSLRVASFAKKLVLEQCNDHKMADNAFTAGLLHDIGQIILATKKTEDFGDALRQAHDSGRLLIEIEKEMFGATHAEIGGYLMELWGLPDAIVEAITFYNIPSGVSDEEFSIATALHVANYFGEGDENADILPTSSLDSLHLERLGLLDQVEKWFDLCHSEYESPLTSG